MKIFDNIDKTLLDYFKNNNLEEFDFYCRECGNLMIDIDELKDLEYFSVLKSGKKSIDPHIRHKETHKIYTESEKNRWCINGRTLSGKIYFRHLYWDCFFRKLRQTEDIERKARKGKWYRKIVNGQNIIPAACTSPSKYYKFLFDITDEELDNERSKFDTASLKSFIRRYGKEEGLKKFKEYSERQAYTCSKEYMKETRGWTDKQWNQFNASRASTKENFMKRYGKDLGEKRWEDYCNYETYAGCSLKYFIDKYGEEDGKLKYLQVNASKSISLENFIKKYGEIEGKRKYAMVKHKAYSKISQLLNKTYKNSYNLI